MSPRQAVDVVRESGLAEPERLILDYAAAGLLKGYALAIVAVVGAQERQVRRQAAISPDLWRRIIEQEKSADVWRGGTVRLKPVPSAGWPEIDITGMSFNPKSISRLIEHYGGAKAVATTDSEDKTSAPAHLPDAPFATKANKRPTADVCAIPSGAQTVTVKQAMAALGLGRTKIYELIDDGRLVKIKIDRATRITVESIRAITDAAIARL